MDFKIVEGNPSLFEVIVFLYYLFYKELREKQGWSIGSIEEYKMEVRRMLKRDKFFIAFVDNTPAGFVRISERDCAYWIEEIYVKPEFRGRGIGKALLKEAENYIRQYDSVAYIMVLPQDLNALRFWLRMGYNILNTIELAKDLSQEKVPMRVFEVFGFPLLVYKWRKENFSPLEKEFLEVLEKFFEKFGREDFLKVVCNALKKALENNGSRYKNE